MLHFGSGLIGQFPTSTPAQRRAFRAALDADLAARLKAVEVDPYVSADVQTYVDLASEGVLIEERGPQLRNISLFRTIAARQGHQYITGLRAYLHESGIDGTDVLRFVLRHRRAWTRLTDLRKSLKHLGTLVQRAAGWARAKYRVDLILRKLEAEPRAGGLYIDDHCHCWAVPLEGADVEGFRAYMARKFAYFGEAESDVGGGTEIDDYGRSKGPLKDTSAIDDAHLAEYVRQTYRLHLWSPLGALKAYRIGLDAADEQAVEIENDGQKHYIRLPRVHRPRRLRPPLPRPATNHLLAIRLAWIDGALRLVAIVNNFTSWTDLAARYDLDHAIARARQALVIMEDTATHKSDHQPLWQEVSFIPVR